MAGNIPRAFIDDLIERIDIVEVIDHRVKLKKSGKNYSACCPFHDEKSPSFSVSPDKQFYYCFGCGATGNALGFLMEYERLAFPDAVESLAKLAGLTVPREENADPKQRAHQQAQEQARNTLYTLMEASSEFYERQLRESDSRDKAVSYLKNRGLSGRIAKDFGIGYAPPGWDNLSGSIGSSNEKQDRLLEAGMLINNEEKERLYDRFRDRIMFPIRDTRGRVIGFGGRVLGNDKPKYLNSPETPIFSKGKELYGLYEARQAYKQLPRLLVVEGYMDVVALAQFDIRYGVATLGTACGADHLARAFRFTNEIVFCFDGDAAGRKAARRALENSLPTMEDGRKVKFLYLPEGEDPDTLIRQIGADKFTKLIEGATPLESFLFDEIGRNIDSQTMEGRAHLCKLTAPMLDELPRGIYRELMFQQLANRTKLNIDTIMTLLSELPKAQSPAPAQTAQTESTPTSYQPVAPYPSKTKTNKDSTRANYSKSYDSATDYSTNESGQTDQNWQHPTDDNYQVAPLSSDHKSITKNTLKTQNPTSNKALALLLFKPKLAQIVEDTDILSHCMDSSTILLLKIIEFLQQRPEYKKEQIVAHWQGMYGPEQGQELQGYLEKGELYYQIDDLKRDKEDRSFNYEQEFADTIDKLTEQQTNKDCDAILSQLNAKPLHTLTDAEKQLYKNAIVARSKKS
ncbi:MAG: DNA primase [Pseudohongiellaceae bacterium]|jgi:DNA primase